MDVENVAFNLDAFYGSYWRRVLKIFTAYIRWLLISLVLYIVVNGMQHLLFILMFVLFLLFIVSCYFAYNVLLSVKYDATTSSLRLTYTNFDKVRIIKIDNRDHLKIYTRKRYRYRYPVDCLIFEKDKKIIFSQEAINGWTIEDFKKIESYFKTIHDEK